MITNHSEALDEMLALFMVPWGLAGYPLEVPNVAFDLPGTGETWARWTVTHAAGAQSTLAGAHGRSRFAKGGNVTVEVFTPLGTGLKAAYDAAQVALNAYEGKRTASDVWFRNVRIADGGRGRGGDAAWWSTVVTADFEYENTN